MAETELKSKENIEGLLYTYLKYAHLAHLRRLQRYPSACLSIAEFDSIQLGLQERTAAADPLEMQETLRSIVAYLTWRKDSAKSASILILRFFHGYYPDEIMRIAQMTRQSVDNRLQDARGEVEHYLSNPGCLRIMRQTAPPEVLPLQIALPFEQTITELQRMIFSSCRTECLPENLLLETYRTENSKPIARELLAHIVSCEHCLNLASRSYDITPPSNRSPEESLGPDRRTRSGAKQNTFSTDNSISRVLRTAQDRMCEVYEHRPRKLIVAINGSVAASRDTNSPLNKMEINLSAEKSPEFIEVASEQGVCLLAVHVMTTPPDAPPEQREAVELSLGRKIEVRLQITSVGSLVEVSYYDPSLAADTEQEAAEIEIDEPELADPFTPSAVKTADGKPKVVPCRPWSRVRSWLDKFSVPKLNPVFAIATSLTLAVMLLAAFWSRIASKPNANDLLARAVAAHTEGTAAGFNKVIASFTGCDSFHDLWSGRKGDFARLMEVQQIQQIWA
jgi:hypothetical protein